MSHRRIAPSILSAFSLVLLTLAVLSCDDADPVSTAEAQKPVVGAAGPGSGPGFLTEDSLALLGPDGVAYSLASGDFPFSTTVSSWQDAFSIKQAGTGRSGQFIVGNPSNTKEALMASHNGSGTALYAIARGTGRAGYYRIDNASNGNGALIGETNGTGAGILAYTTGTGPAANFVVNNASNASAALRAETSGTGNLLELVADASEVGHIDGNGGLSLTGGLNQGTVPAEGAGARFMWYPGKAAFRAGYITGAEWDDASIGHYSVATGSQTTASNTATVAMGWATAATGSQAVATGNSTTASGSQSFAAGYGSQATASYAVAMGFQATAGGSSSVALGHSTTASGVQSTALGRFASTNGQQGAFVIGDASVNSLVQSNAPNRFVARFENGYYLYSNSSLTAGVTLAGGGGSWSTVSDEAMKENFRELDGESVLEKIALMGIPEWNYRSQDASVRHAGPTAQDFHAAFGLGTSDRTIATVDADGIALAGVKALERRTREQAEQIEALEREGRERAAELDALRAENRALRSRLDRLEAALLDR